jgi:hypothetical protein
MRWLVAYPAIYDDKIHNDEIHDHESYKQTKTVLKEDLSKQSARSTGHSLGSLCFFSGDVNQEFLAVSARLNRRLTHRSSCFSPHCPPREAPLRRGFCLCETLGFSPRHYALRRALLVFNGIVTLGGNPFMRQPEDPDSPEPPKPIKEPPPDKPGPMKALR